MNVQRRRDLTFDGLVHDLNNVFQTIIDAAELIATDPAWASVAAIVTRSVEQGNRIVSSIAESEHSQIELGLLLDNAISFSQDFNAATKQPPLEFIRDFEPGLCVEMKAAALERVFVNLFINASRAALEAGRSSCHVMIAAITRAGAAEITIADDGPGIPESILPVIFEPGVSTDPTHDGLGLHIVRSMVGAAGGYVSASNRTAGGAEFRITLPAANRSATVSETATAAHS